MSTKSSRKLLVRAATTVSATGLLVLTAAGVASAHVEATSPDNPSKGGDAEIVFRVPNEEATAHTVKVQVNFSTTSPITNADILPVPGWTAQETMMTLPKPVNMDNETVTQAVKSITWTAPKGAGIAPGQFQQFTISVEGLPDNTNKIVMPAIQTYDNGDVVNWNQPTVAGQPEPEHPVPNLTLAAASADDAAPAPAATTPPPAAATQADSDGTARWLGGIGIVVAAVALGFGLGAFTRGRRRPTPDSGSRSKAGASA